MRRRGLVLLTIAAVILLAACTAGPNPAVGTPDASGDTAGFFLGLWHGVIAPIAFVISLFSDTVNVYEAHNSGAWYDFGFVLGAVFLIGGSHGARKRR